MTLVFAQSTAGFWHTLTSDFSHQEKFALCIVLIGCVTAIAITTISLCGAVWYHLRKGERETELVRDLLHQGRSAEEIEKIVRPADGWSRAWERCLRKKEA
ncbi:hypothetical protein [Botrimarina sp.]|uniref:hypothetical protein n=1 Tax=Botrimarina sp. TaxID=2795802 RepID=UPI0032EE6089